MPVREDLRRLFLNPPKGGNGRGVPTTSPMAPMPQPDSGGRIPYGPGLTLTDRAAMREQDIMPTGPAARPSLRTCFDAGEMSARVSTVRSEVVGVYDGRNYLRENTPLPNREDDPNGPNHYDIGAASNGTPRAGTGVDGRPLGRNPALTLDPETEPTNAVRSDGKRPYTLKQITR